MNCNSSSYRSRVRLTHIEGQLLKHSAACFAPTAAPKSSGGSVCVRGSDSRCSLKMVNNCACPLRRAPALGRGRNCAHSFNGSCKSVSTAGALDRRTLYNEDCHIEPTTRDAPYFSIFAFNSFLLNRIQDNRECDEEKSQAARICEPRPAQASLKKATCNSALKLLRIKKLALGRRDRGEAWRVLQPLRSGSKRPT